jgi:hypothetical protein
MKSFCVLEQGNSVNAPLTLQKMKLFTTEHSDFYRLNWERDDDPNAFLKYKSIYWSEGRSLLYEFVPKNYQYYIFTDDDISFHSRKNGDIVLEIKEFFDRYKPLTGTFYNPHAWQSSGKFIKNRFAKRLSEWIDRTLLDKRAAYPIGCYDQELQFFEKSFAEVMFPAPYHGSGRSIHYSQWVCHHLYPGKQLCLRTIRIKNNQRLPHHDGITDIIGHGTRLVQQFNQDVYEHSFDPLQNWSFEKISIRNRWIGLRTVDRRDISFTMKDLAKVYNIHNRNFRERKSLRTQ